MATGYAGRWPFRNRCRSIGPLLRPYLEGELEAEEAVKVRTHLARCPQCSSRAAAFRAVVAVVRDVPAPEMPPGFADRLRIRLAAEPPAALPLWRRLAQRASQSGRLYPLGLSAAAALLLVTAGVLLMPAERITAQEITTRVQESWTRLQDYHCTLRTTIAYRGRRLETTREQWFRKPHHFRIVSDEGQRRITYISGREVVTYLPDANVVIHRPRREDEPDLPFPFRSTTDLQGDITVDAFLDRLHETRAAEFIGREEVLGKECYVLKFRTLKPPARRGRRPRSFDCRMWVDQDTFLPLKLKMYYNDRTWSYTRATGLEVNRGLAPELFAPQLPAGVRLVRGDVDQRLFERDGAAVLQTGLDPTRTVAAIRRRRRMTFAALTPTWLPAGYRLMGAEARHERLKGRIERTLTLTFITDGGDALTIVQEPAGQEQRGLTEAVCTQPGTRPYPYVRLTGLRAGTAVRLMAAGLTREQAARILRALRTASELQHEEESPSL